MDRQKRAGRLAALVLSLSFLPGSAFAAIVIDSATVSPNPVAAGSTAGITVNVTLSGGSDADWQSTNIALVKAGENPIQLFCGNSPDFNNAGGAQQFTFNNLPIPNYIAGNWSVRVRAYDDDGECTDTSFPESGDAENSAAAVAQVTQPIAPPSVELDLVLCLDGSTSLSLSEWNLQIAGTEAGLETALDPDHLDSTVRLTTIVFATGVNRAIGPTVIDSEGTLDAYRTAITNLARPTGSTNTAGCFSAAQAVLCGSTTCPDDGIRRVIDISTDGNPTVENCPGPQSSTQCAILRRDEAESAGVDTLNVIGVGDGIGLTNMQNWAFPTPVQVFDTSEGEFPQPGDRGFVVLVEEFTDYGVAIAAKLMAEITGDFFVHKTYSDGNMTPVSVMLTCTGGNIDSANPATATPGGPAAVFNLSDFDPDNDTCTAEEVGGLPNEYTADESDCQAVFIDAEGECTIVNNLSTATFTVTKDFIPDHGAPVSVSLSCSSGAPVDSPLMVSEGAPAEFTVEGFLPGATCTATEVVPSGYTWSNPDDCSGVDILDPGSCVLTNTLNTATFTVSKTYNDANPNPVQVSLLCGSGNVTVNNNMATPGGPDASFTVTGYLTGAMCTATEAEPVGYTWDNPQDCQGVVLSSQGSSCNLHNIASASDVDLVKTGSLNLGGDSDSNPGDLISYTFTVTNSGNTVLTSITVSDPLISPITCPSGNPIPTLNPGGIEICTGSYAITQADIDAGVRDNTATASGTDPFAATIMDSDDHSESIPQSASMTVDKTVTNTGTGPAGVFQAGDTITYGITVTNSGNVTLTGVVVNDSVAGLNNAACSASLAPGDMCSVNTGSYTVTQADINNNGGGDGDIDNTAIASSNQAPNAQDSAQAPLVAQLPDIQLVKTGSLVLGGNGVANPGDLINYTFQTFNNGNVTLSNITVSDPLISPITCPSGNPIPSLAVGANETCTGSYSITQADIDAGVRDNTATASGEDPSGAPVMDDDDHSESIPRNPAMTVNKTVTNTGSGPGNAFQAGDTVTYGVEVSNSGNVTLTNVAVNDAVAGLNNVACAATLAPGVSCEVNTGFYLVSQADIDNNGGGDGDIDNTAVASSDQAPNAQDSAAAPLVAQDQGIMLVKDGALNLGGDGANPGDLINYTFQVINTGNVTLTNITVSDPLIAPITCPSGNPIPSLGTGEGETCTGSYAITQADIDAGVRDNTATASGMDPSGAPVEDSDDHSVSIPQSASMMVAKTVTNTGSGNGGLFQAGDTITYGITVTNSGNVTLTGVVINDTVAGLTNALCSNELDPGANCSVNTGSYTVTQADIDNEGGGDGDIDNTAVASSVQSPDAQDSAAAPLVKQAAAIQIIKDGSLNSGGDGANPGDLIEYSFQVINIGNVTLTNVSASDPLVASISCPSGNPIPSLGAGESETCTGSYAITQADIDAGVVDNTATASGTAPSGPVMDSDDHSESIPQSASMLVDKTVSNTGTGPGGAFQAGDTVTYGITVTNSGNLTLTDVVVNDSVAGLSNAVCAASLEPGAMCAVDTGSYLVTQDDIDNDGGGDGDIDNTAIASSNEAPDAQDSAAAPLVKQGAAMLLLKDGILDLGGDGIPNPGDVISYTFEVTNTGNVTLSDVSVSDPLIATITCPGGNPIASLAPGEGVTCNGSYALSQQDVDNGFVENTASAEGECDAAGCPVGDDDTEIVPILQVGGLDVVKTAEPQSYSLVGQQISYTFEVTNTGNVTLANVAVSDPLITAAPNNGTIDCTPESNPIADLAPGEVVTCTGIYTITEADIDAGSVGNSVSVIGQCPLVIQGEPGGGQENCPPEDDDEETIGRVAVNLSKSVQSGPTLEEDGTYTVIYLITATNLGGGAGLYDVVDTFMPGTGITLNTASATYQAGTENDQSGTLGNFPTDDVIVTGEGLADGLIEFWVVDANFFVDPTEVDPDPCDPGEPLPGASFYNSVAGPDPEPGDDDTCAGLPPEEIDLSKTVVSLVETGGGSFTVTYRITATNLSDGPGSYDLVDTFDPGTGINVVSAQLTAYVPGSENNQSGTLAGPLPYTFTSGETLVTGEDLAGQADESWTIVIQFDIDGSQVGSDYECAGPGTGTYNEVSGSETDPNPGNNSDCEDPPLLRTTFRVTKDFDDDNPAGVTVLIECNTGLPLQQQGVVHDPDAPVGPGDFTVIEFVVGDFEPGTMDCDIEEVIPAGYAPTYTAGATTGLADNFFEDEGGCHYELITGGQFTCHIFNELQPVGVIVEKIWIDESPEFQQSTVVEVTLECDGPIIGGFQCFGGEGNGNYCSQQFIDPNNPGEFAVLPHFEGTTCSATEEPISGVLTDESDCEEMIVFPGQGDSCVIVNTRLYAGIPTLSRNGLILLTLLMLGIGALAYRRFA